MHVFGPRDDCCLVTTDRTITGDFGGGYTDNHPNAYCCWQRVRKTDDYYGSRCTTYIIHWDCTGDDVDFTCPTERAQSGRTPYIRSSGQLQIFYNLPAPFVVETAEPGAV